MFLTLFEKVTIFAKSKVILMQFENFCISMHVSDSAQKMQLWTVWFFGTSYLVLGKCWSHVRVWRAFGGSFSSPQKMQKLSSGSNESSIFAIFEDIFFAFVFAKNIKNMKIKLSPAPELNFCGPAPLKKRFMHLHWVSPFCEFRLTRIE